MFDTSATTQQRGPWVELNCTTSFQQLHKRTFLLVTKRRVSNSWIKSHTQGPLLLCDLVWRYVIALTGQASPTANHPPSLLCFIYEPQSAASHRGNDLELVICFRHSDTGSLDLEDGLLVTGGSHDEGVSLAARPSLGDALGVPLIRFLLSPWQGGVSNT